nr:VOC family protein [Streptomyces sp. HNM0574]
MPDIRSGALEESKRFYGRLGLVEVMDLGWVVTMASPSNPTAQVTFFDENAAEAVEPDLSVEIEDVAAVDPLHAELAAAGAEIVMPPRDEPWGVRRFFVRDPNGKVVNVVAHRPD